MDYYDIDNDGTVDVKEFMRGLWDELNTRWQDIVSKAFHSLDPEGYREIMVSDIAQAFDVSCHKDFMEKRKTKDVIL